MEMARTKNTERKTGLTLNLFRNVNVHGIDLLDAGKVKQLCEQKGKSARFCIRVRARLRCICLCIRTCICAFIDHSCLYVVDRENAILEGSNVAEKASLSSLSEFTNTPEYSPVSDAEERDADSFVVDVDCEVHTSGVKAEEIDPAEHADLDHFVVQETYPFPPIQPPVPFHHTKPKQEVVEVHSSSKKRGTEDPVPSSKKGKFISKDLEEILEDA